jgi:hypothetical protein
MKYRILGIVAICLLIIAGVMAFGPHTRFTNLNEQCIYYNGLWSCRVPSVYCTPDGKDYHIILDKSMCLDNYIEIGPPSPAALPAVVPAQEQQMPQPETIAQQPEVPAGSYLGFVIAIILLFAVMVIGWILYYETKLKLRLAEGIRCITVCPRCGVPMEVSGSLKQGPRGGQRLTYVCPKCGHRTMTTKGRKKANK